MAYPLHQRHPKRQHRHVDSLLPDGQTMMMISRTKTYPELKALMDQGGLVCEDDANDEVAVGGGAEAAGCGVKGEREAQADESCEGGPPAKKRRMEQEGTARSE